MVRQAGNNSQQQSSSSVVRPDLEFGVTSAAGQAGLSLGGCSSQRREASP